MALPALRDCPFESVCADHVTVAVFVSLELAGVAEYVQL